METGLVGIELLIVLMVITSFLVIIAYSVGEITHQLNLLNKPVYNIHERILDDKSILDTYGEMVITHGVT